MNIKIVILTSAHRLTDVRVLEKEAVDLAGAGSDLVIIGWRDVPSKIDAKRLPVRGSVRFRTVPRPWSRFDRMTRTVVHVIRAALKENGDVYHLHDPELLPAGALLAHRGKVVVFDAHESLQSAVLTKGWIPSRFRKILSRIVGRTMTLLTSKVSGVVAATPAIARESGNPNTVLVQNYPRIGELFDETSIPYAQREDAVAYVGGFSRLRGALEIVKAVGIVAKRRPVTCIFAGNTREAGLLDEMRSSRGWPHVEYLGWRSREDVARILGRVRAGLVLFQFAPNHLEAQPNKMFEYMSAGLPVVASDFPLWREIVDGASCGLLVDPQDPDAIADAIKWILDHPAEAQEMGLRGREAVVSTYNWEAESEKLIAFYRSLQRAEQSQQMDEQLPRAETVSNA